jgi:PAS domain S-box-containing protein
MAHSRDAILGVDHKGTIVFWNKGAEQIFGYSSPEILGQPVTRLISEKNRGSHAPALSAFLTGNCGETALIEGEALRKNGSTFPIELSFSIEQQNGKLLGLAVVTKGKRRTLLRSFCHLPGSGFLSGRAGQYWRGQQST